MEKREFTHDAEVVDWETEILRALRNAEPGDYGNLDKHGNFFRLRYLTTVTVPQALINKLVQEDKIVMMSHGVISNTYYKIGKGA